MGELLILLVILLIVGFFAYLIFMGVVGFGALGLTAKVDHDRKAAGANKKKILDSEFNGARQTVIYDTRPGYSLEASVVIAGAIDRDYELVHDDNGVLTFKKV